MKYTLLELTQDVLSSMDSDEINSITDTTEAQQVVKVIKTVYDDIVSRSELPLQRTLFNLDASTDSTKPILMTKPLTIENIEWVRYNCIEEADTDPSWKDIPFLPPADFLMMVQGLSPSETDVEAMTHTSGGFTFTINYKNDVAPTYYTSFDDHTLIFDSYDNQVDTTLQTIKTLCYGVRTNTFVESDVFVPNLQANQFSLLLNEAKSLAWAELKQTPHNKAEQTARRNWVHLGKTRQHIPTGKEFNSGDHSFDKLLNFGRK